MQIKVFILYSLYYAKAYIEFVRSISTSLGVRQHNLPCLSKKCCDGGNSVSDLTGLRVELQTSRYRDKRIRKQFANDSFSV